MIEIDGENWYSVSEVSKIIAIKNCGRNKFMLLLRQEHILQDNNFPSQYYLNMGLARMKEVVRNGYTFYTPVFSTKGINYLKNKLLC